MAWLNVILILVGEPEGEYKDALACGLIFNTDIMVGLSLVKAKRLF